MNKPSEYCPVTACMEEIGSKWKPIILYRVSMGINRFSTLLKNIKGINKQMLSKQLKELEKSQILERKMYAEIPPRVEYTITAKGKTLMPVVQAMKKWGQKPVEKPSGKKTDTQGDQQLPLFG
ncbi:MULTISPECIES: winged helix-turn-helix transcriptional regulator [Maribacter]|uniref:Helix-turn-helix domain-containing protein n=1 Tax=Maribacter flavus TaxID=1658664 RepID=A0ABU7IKD6_9FLAO|nr:MULTISPECIES: helix-turn-helix domain-containing protein [Maribacter]MDC6406072.1 helix-turn-helix domain-containing protein [Maribacter sp. PR66]MEE1973143.1 helix-turn-helix domain-containing protein [Maribacter flavus]